MKIKIKVKPRSKEQSVEKISPQLFSEAGYEGLYFVKIRSLPEEGRANLEVVKLLTRYFGKQVRIKSGFSSRDKIAEVSE